MTHRTTWRARVSVPVILMAVFAIAHAARYREPAKTSTDPAGVSERQAGVPHDALQIAVAEDGHFVAPDAEEAAALRRSLVRDVRTARPAAPTVERRDNGTLSMVVGFDQINFLTVHRDEDGSFTADHGGATGSVMSVEER